MQYEFNKDKSFLRSWQSLMNFINQRLHCSFHDSILLYHIMSHMIPDYTRTLNFCHIHLNLLHHLRLILPSSYLNSCFYTKMLYALPPRMLSTYPSYLFLINLINFLILGKEQESWSSPFCNIIHPPVTRPVLFPNVLINTFSRSVLFYGTWHQVSRCFMS